MSRRRRCRIRRRHYDRGLRIWSKTPLGPQGRESLGSARLRTGVCHLRGERAWHADRCLFKTKGALPRRWPANRLLVCRTLHIVGRRHRHVFKPRRRILCLRPGQQVSRRLADHELSARGCEDRHQAYIHLRAAHLVPRQPDAVAGPQLGLAEVAGELLRRERILPVGCLAIRADFAVVVAIHDELPFDRHGLIAGVVKVNPPAETSRGLLARRIEQGRRPDHRHPHRTGVVALDHLRLALGIPALGPIGRRERLAAGYYGNAPEDDERGEMFAMHGVWTPGRHCAGAIHNDSSSPTLPLSHSPTPPLSHLGSALG